MPLKEAKARNARMSMSLKYFVTLWQLGGLPDWGEPVPCGLANS